MTTPNPYAPPESPILDLQPRQDSKVQRVIVAVLVGIQFVFALRYAGVSFQMVSAGVVSGPVVLLWLAGSLCLYAAAFRLMYSRKRGKLLFLFAAVGLGVSVPFWPFISMLTIVAGLGAALGVAGWWVARSTTPVQDTNAEPRLP